MRRMTLAVCLVCTTVAVWGAGRAAADPVNSPHVSVFTITCEGVPEFQVVGTGAAGHVLGSNSIAVLLSGTLTQFVNGVQMNQNTFDTGQGVSALACTGFSEFTVGADTIRIEITDARILLTPASS